MQNHDGLDSRPVTATRLPAVSRHCINIIDIFADHAADVVRLSLPHNDCMDARIVAFEDLPIDSNAPKNDFYLWSKYPHNVAFVEQLVRLSLPSSTSSASSKQ